jgi:hypothetical protein
MDPGLQVYGGALFTSLRESGDSVFVSLPPPTHTYTGVKALLRLF